MILVCYGTRPEFLKITPLLEKMRGVIPFKTLFVGQHTDLVEEDSDYKVEIKEGENRLDSIISSVMNSFDFQKEGITHVMVQGDTATSFAVAVSAYHMQLR
jgi:UDP-N-acetylglucosamine 2-epimerase